MDPVKAPREDESGQTTQTAGQPPLPEEDEDEAPRLRRALAAP